MRYFGKVLTINILCVSSVLVESNWGGSPPGCLYSAYCLRNRNLSCALPGLKCICFSDRLEIISRKIQPGDELRKLLHRTREGRYVNCFHDVFSDTAATPKQKKSPSVLGKRVVRATTRSLRASNIIKIHLPTAHDMGKGLVL